MLDASVLVRALVDRAPAARQWLEACLRGENESAVPDHAFLEVGHAIVRLVRAGYVAEEDGLEALDDLAAAPLVVVPLRAMTRPVAEAALALGLSAYDAAYVVAAEARGVVLVTADRRLAAAYDPSELVV